MYILSNPYLLASTYLVYALFTLVDLTSIEYSVVFCVVDVMNPEYAVQHRLKINTKT